VFPPEYLNNDYNMFSEISTTFLYIPGINKVQYKKTYKIEVEVFRYKTPCCPIGDICIARNLISTLNYILIINFCALIIIYS